MQKIQNKKSIAVLVPCLNEEKTIGLVVEGFKKYLPEAVVYVYDNGSTDKTREVAEAAGAIVGMEIHRGKGRVMRKMFRDVDADIYVLVDGDNTYFPEDSVKLIVPVREGRVDMVVGNRLENPSNESLTALHQFGNRLIVAVLNISFGSRFKDIESGYRVMNRDLVKNLPLLATAFDIEPELTILALERGYIIEEIPIQYRSRPVGSVSKLRTFRDGFLVVFTIFAILRDYRPIKFFSILSGLFFLLGLASGAVPIVQFFEEGVVRGVPIAMLSVGLMLIAVLMLLAGLIIGTVNRRFGELDELIKKRSS